MKNSYILFFTLLYPLCAICQPDNDACDNAIDISELFGNEIGVGTSVGPFSNVDATGESELAADLVDIWFDVNIATNEPSIDQSVWFKFTGDGNTYQIFTWNCPGSAMYSEDTQLALYSGTCDSLSLVAGNDDMMSFWGWYHAVLNFKAEAGTDYWLLLDGFNHFEGGTWEGIAQGSTCIASMQLERLTDHAVCDQSRDINELFETTTGNTPGFVGPFDDTELGSGIGMNPYADMLGAECWDDGIDDGSVWFTWTGDGNPYTIVHSQCQEGDDTFVYYFGFDSQMALYKGDCGELVPVACSEDIDFEQGYYWAQIGFDSEEGEDYYLRFDGYHWEYLQYDWSAEGAFCLRADLGNVNGIQDWSETLIVDVFPNPAREAVTISWSGDDMIADVVVRDISGKEVLYLNHIVRNSLHQLDLPNGQYTLQVLTSEHSTVKRLQILR
ncbi:MAG: T9SS type A sorting domain-containing protein [Flavobacteriales bacterium]